MRARSDDAELTAEGPALVTCDHCGRSIGVYEPLVVFRDGEARESARAEEPGLPLSANYFHRACFETSRESSVSG
jgi:hypothetical protein